MTTPPRRFEDRLADRAFLDGLDQEPLESLRAKKAEAEELEAELSYARRLLQAKIDILRHEAERRVAGGEPGINGLIDKLPAILSDDDPGSAGRMPRVQLPRRMEEQRREVERLASESSLAQVDTMSVEELKALAERLAEAERSVSDRRRAAHDVVDRVSAEIVNRYKDGSADPSALLGQGGLGR